MEKERIFIILCFAVILSLMHVYSLDYTNPVAVFEFSNNCTYDSVGGYHFQVNDGCDNVAGKNGNGCDMEAGETDSINNSTVATVINGANGGSVSYWFKREGTGIYADMLYCGHSTGGQTKLYSMWYSSNKKETYIGDSTTSNSVLPADTYTDTSNYYHIVITWNSKGHITGDYINNVSRGTATANDKDITDWTDCRIGSTLPATSWGDGIIDELYFYNFQLTAGDINQLYRSGTGYFYSNFSVIPPTASFTINNINLSSGNYTNNLYLGFNGSVTNTQYDNFNCTISFNNTPQYSYIPSDIRQTQSYYLEYCTDEKGWNVNVSCYNTNSSDEFVVNDVFLDCILPELQITSNFVNNSAFYDSATLHYNVTFTDTNLYAVNHTIIDLDDNSIKNNIFVENIVGDEYILNISNSTEKLGIGSYKIIMQAWDSHTAAKLKYDIVKADDYTYYYNGVKIYSDKKLKFDKKTDKYVFEIDKKAWFCYATPNEFIKIDNSIYPEHYIDFKNKIWIDEYYYTFIEIGNNELCFYNDKDTAYKTASLGDLNYNDLEYYFTVIATPTLSDALLSDINATLYNISLSLPDITTMNNNVSDIAEELKMLGYIILFIGLLAVGLSVKSIYITFAAYITGQLLGFLFIVTYGSLGTVLDSIKTGIALMLIIIFTVLEIVMLSPQKELA